MNLDGNSLLAGFAVSLVGAGFFMYGKKQGRPRRSPSAWPPRLYPYFISNPWLMLGVFVALLG